MTGDVHEELGYRRRLPEAGRAPNAALSLTAVAHQTVGNKRLDINRRAAAGPEFSRLAELPEGMRALLYRNLGHVCCLGADRRRTSAFRKQGRFQSLIRADSEEPQDLIKTISWNHDPASAETFHAMPLKGRNGELLGRAAAWQLGERIGVAEARDFEDCSRCLRWPRW